MSEIRRNKFLKELRQNKEYMLFIHHSMLNSRFTWFIVALGIISTVAEYHTGGAFSGFMVGILLYLLNYLIILHTAAPVFAMKGRVLGKIVHQEYVDYIVENTQMTRTVISENADYQIGDEVYLYRFRPCFYFSADKTGMAAA